MGRRAEAGENQRPEFDRRENHRPEIGQRAEAGVGIGDKRTSLESKQETESEKGPSSTN